MKLCKTCSRELEETSFRSRNGKLLPSCRPCAAEAYKAYYLKHQDEIKSRKRTWMADQRKKPEVAERIRSRARRDWKENPERKARAQAYYRDLKENRFFEHRARQWNGRLRATGLRLSAKSLSDLWNAQSGLCALSGRRLDNDAHLDHILPLSRGGESKIENLRWLDPTVNLARRALSDEEFIRLCLDVVEVSDRWIGQRIAKVDAIPMEEA